MFRLLGVLVLLAGSGLLYAQTPVPDIDVQRPAGASRASGSVDDIGSLPTGIQVAVSWTIANTGGAALTMPADPVTVASPVNCTVSVLQQPAQLTLNPTDASPTMLLIEATSSGEFSFTLQIVSDDPDENPYVLAVRGNEDDEDEDDEDEDEDDEDDDEGGGVAESATFGTCTVGSVPLTPWAGFAIMGGLAAIGFRRRQG